MGWLSVVATGLVVRGAMRRKRRRAAEIKEARRIDELRWSSDEALGDGIEYWPPEEQHGR